MPREENMIGGIWSVVEIDETVVSKKRKYHSCRYYKEIYDYKGRKG